MRNRWFPVAIVVAACLGTAGTAVQARPPHKKALADYLGPGLARKLNDCRTCHVAPEPGADDLGGPAAQRVRQAAQGGARPSSRRPASPRASRRGSRRSPTRTATATASPTCSSWSPATSPARPTTGRPPPSWPRAARPSPRSSGRGAGIRGTRSSGSIGPPVPVVRDPGPGSRNPIDAFIAAEHEARGLTPRPEASRPVLLRRVYLDLIGLPPTPEELHAFLDDASRPTPTRRSSIACWPVRGTASAGAGTGWTSGATATGPAGASRSATASRTSGTGATGSSSRSTATSRYDRMIVEMLAADEAAPDDLDALRATGYLVRNFKLLSREKWMQDTVDHTGQAFLGVTLGCARCHDHMYDPILQKEYYQVRAIFEPHQVRIDRVPGALDTAKDGMPRAFDAQPDAKTLPVRPRRRPQSDRQAARARASPSRWAAFREVEPVALPAGGGRARPAPGSSSATRSSRAREAASARADDALADEAERPSKDAEAIERAARSTCAVAAGAARSPVMRSSGPRSWSSRARKGSKEWTTAAEAATAAQRALAVAQARRGRARGAAGAAARPRRRSGPRPTRLMPMPLKALAARRGREPISRRARPTRRPPRTTYPGDEHGPPAGLRPMDRRRSRIR